MSNKKILILILIILIIVILIFIYFKFNKKDIDVITLYGNIEIRQVDLGFRVEGRVKKLLKEEGDKVKKGDLLAILDDITYRARYEKSVQDINLYKAQSENAELIYKRNIPLCADGTTSKQDCDSLIRNKKASFAKVQSEIRQNKIYKDDWDNTKIYAPNDGIVTTRIIEEGAVVNMSTPVYTISLDKPVWIRAYVSEKD